MKALQLEKVSFAYLDATVLRNINLSVEKGEMIGLLGPNGSGKSTLLKLIAGVLRPNQGEIYLDGLNLKQLKRKTIAQRVAVMPQQFSMPFAFTVKEVVALGRTPFLKMFSNGREDEEIIDYAMQLSRVKPLEQRFFNELSGGERQRAMLAMALAQQPDLLLLDEPTVHLDINHQIELLELVRSLNKEQGLTIIAAMHDLNLASLYFERLILLREGSIFTEGRPVQVLTSEIIQQVFSATVQVEPHPLTHTPHIVVLPKGD